MTRSEQNLYRKTLRLCAKWLISEGHPFSESKTVEDLSVLVKVQLLCRGDIELYVTQEPSTANVSDFQQFYHDVLLLLSDRFGWMEHPDMIKGSLSPLYNLYSGGVYLPHKCF